MEVQEGGEDSPVAELRFSVGEPTFTVNGLPSFDGVDLRVRDLSEVKGAVTDTHIDFVK